MGKNLTKHRLNSSKRVFTTIGVAFYACSIQNKTLQLAGICLVEIFLLLFICTMNIHYFIFMAIDSNVVILLSFESKVNHAQILNFNISEVM